MSKILLVEDDPQISKSLKINLSLNGFHVSLASSVHEALNQLSENSFHLILMDIGLPDGNGLDLCKTVRETDQDTPILFLSARTDEATVVRGITLGADDYIRKPFGTEELKTRMNKILKRLPSSRFISFGDLKIEMDKRMVTIKDKVLSLGRKELEILMVLAKRAGDVVTREAILNSVQENEIFDRTIDSHMSHLRKKIRDVAGDALQINSIYGVGYRLEWR